MVGLLNLEVLIFWKLTPGDNSNDHFRLQTLWCDKRLDLSRIIRSQTELQMLGIYEYPYAYYDRFRFLETFEQLQNAQLHLPVVFALTYDRSDWDALQRISIFPTFYDCHPAIHQVLAESFDKDQGSYNAGTIDAYLVDSCDSPCIQVLTENITMTVPNRGHTNTTSLIFAVQNTISPGPYPNLIVSFLLTMIVTRELMSMRDFKRPHEAKKIMSLFPYLVKLDLEHYSSLDIGDGLMRLLRKVGYSHALNLFQSLS